MMQKVMAMTSIHHSRRTLMNCTQNEKLNQVTPHTLIVGVDIAKFKHVARAQDDRGKILGKALTFTNTKEGFDAFFAWLEEMQHKHEKADVLVGMEPTGHYWLNLAYTLKERLVSFGVVNPLHVKRSKELDDNSPTKNDIKDARVIAQLIKDGRFSYPRLPMDQDAEVKAGITIRNQIVGDFQALQGRIHNWLDKYFPEFLTVFKDWSGKMALATLEHIPLPVQLNQTTPERVAEIWSTYGGVQRPSHKRIQRLQEAAGRSVGLTVGLQMAQREIATNIKRYKMLKEELHALEKQLEDLVLTLPGIAEMLTVPGVGMVTVIELYSELGDIKNFENPRQILKYAGLNLRESSSGKHKGQTRITKRGRAKLRALLFRTVMPLVRHNRAFKALHQYYTTRQENPLRKKQSLIVLCGKLVRVLHTVGQKQCPFDEERMIRDIPHLSLALGA